MSNSSRYLAFIAYLLSLPGALFVLLARRSDAFAVYHARQSLAIAIAAIVTPLAWVVVAWPSAWIPYVGLAVSWVVGMVFALRGLAKPAPLVGAWATRRPRVAVAPDAEQETETPSELIERTSPSDA